MPSSPRDGYARLLSSPRGYPLWTPEPSNELLIERRGGLRIGDVGVIIPDDGGFDVFFNICLPRDHPFHRRYGVPEGFRCIDQSELDIKTILNAENPGHVISPAPVTRAGSAHSLSDPPQSLSSNDVILPILPKGAQWYKLLNDSLFLEQANRHGVEWHNYAINRRHRTISHDSLYLITGIYKTSSSSIAVFENATNQAVFTRGFKIALRSKRLGTRRIGVEANDQFNRSIPVTRTSIVPSNSRLLNSLARLTKNRGNNVSQTIMHDEAVTDPNEGPSKSDALGHDGHGGVHVEIQRMPDIPPEFHPSDPINQCMFRKDLFTNITITYDSHWISTLEDSLLTSNELGQEPRLETVLSENYRVVSHKGVLDLERKGESDRLDESVLYATTKKGSEEADKQSPLTNMKEQLVPAEVVISVQENFRESNDAITLGVSATAGIMQYVCRWLSNGQPCNTIVFEDELFAHLRARHIHQGPNSQRVTCLWAGCGVTLRRDSLDRHVQEMHLRLHRFVGGNQGSESSRGIVSGGVD